VSGNSLAIHISKRIFYQDRLGTNKGKTRKQCVPLSYQVENLQDTIALSGNFIDANNLQRSMLHLQKESRAGHEPSVRLFEGLAGVAARAQTQRRGLHAHTWDEPTWDRDPAKEAGGAEEGGQGRAGGGGVRLQPGGQHELSAEEIDEVAPPVRGEEAPIREDDGGDGDHAHAT